MQKAYDMTLAADKLLGDLEPCVLTEENLQQSLAALQGIVDKLDGGGFYGVPAWCQNLNSKLERILASRLDEVLDGCRATLDHNWPTGDVDVDEEVLKNPFRRTAPIKHTIKITGSQQLEVQPPVAHARAARAGPAGLAGHRGGPAAAAVRLRRRGRRGRAADVPRTCRRTTRRRSWGATRDGGVGGEGAAGAVPAAVPQHPGEPPVAAA